MSPVDVEVEELADELRWHADVSAKSGPTGPH
jgi:hypothetical protein